eukprot:1332983-Amorphochlora_amoeboformis.AAC.2
MGNCLAETDEDRARLSLEAKRNKQLDKELQLEEKAGRLVHKLLLLGAGESGKSTFFKQLVRIHDKGYDVNSRRAFERSIYKNIINSVYFLFKAVDTYGYTLDSKTVGLRDFFEETAPVDEEANWLIDDKMGDAIKAIWTDPAVQTAFKNRDDKATMFYLFDGAEYFFNKIDEVKADKYIPDEEDIVRCRIRTSGIIEKSFEIKGNHFSSITKTSAQQNSSHVQA